VAIPKKPVSGTMFATGEMTSGKVASSTGALNLKGVTSGAVKLTVGAAAGTYTFTLPNTDGDANQVLTTNGSGVTSWASGGTGTVTSVGLTSSDSSLYISGSPVTSSGTLGAAINPGHSITWTALQTFANASTTGTHTINQLCFTDGTCQNTITPEGSAITMYPWNTATDIATYEGFRTLPEIGSEVDENCVATSGYCASPIDNYVSTSTLSASGALSLSKIPAGTWTFDTYSYIDNTAGTSKLEYTMYRRTSGGTETQLFQATTTEINNTAVGLSTLNSVQQAFAFDPTDRLVMRVKGWTDSGAPITIHWVYGNGNHYSHVTTPITVASEAIAFLTADNIFTGVNTFNGKTIMGNASTTLLSAVTGWVASLFTDNIVNTGKITTANASSTVSSATSVCIGTDCRTAWPSAGSGYEENITFVAAATTTGSLNLINIQGLSYAASANSKYIFEVYLSNAVDVGTAGIKVGMNYSAAGATIESSVFGKSSAAAMRSDRINAFNTASAGAYSIAAADAGLTIKGTITTGANAGNITAQVVKVTSNNVTIYADSYMRITKVQ